jgi:hypothetical protein
MTEYDLAQRERIRQALLAYMKEHKIGVPRLAARIKEAVHRNPEIPVKTLQRFMKGEVRTIDMHVGFLAQFVDKVAQVDPTPHLGVALSAFYSSKDRTDWAGTFKAEEVADPEARLDKRYRSKIEIILDNGAWRVKEVAENGGSRDIYDGALSSSGQIVVVVMKDRLMGLPRTMTVLKQGSDTLGGVSTTAHLPPPIYGRGASLRTRSARITLTGLNVK